MKCLHCGTDLDRLTKLRGAAEYCSEECKRAAEEEFNQLAISRLTRLRPARSSVRSQLGEVREVRSGGETLTVVNYRPGASSVLVTEPPEAGFVLDVRITLARLQRQLPEPIAPARAVPCLPPPAATPAGGPDALRALHSALRSRLRPGLRSRRGMEVFCASWLQTGRAIGEPPEVPVPDPVWPERLALDLQLLGIDDLVRPDAPPPAPFLAPVQHAAIPSRRGPRPMPELHFPPKPGELSLPGPVLSAPRLRIHLPRPSLQTFRPRYGFAPAPLEAPEEAPERESIEEIRIEVPVVADSTARTETAPAERDEPEPAPSVAVEPPSVAVEAPSVAVEPPSVAVEPPSVAVEAPSVAAEPPSVAVEAPSFGFAAEPPAGSGRPAWHFAAAAVLAIAVGAGAWAWTSRPASGRSATTASPSAAKSALDPAVWSSSPAGDSTGIARSRILTVFQPARNRRDFRLEADARIEQQALGIVMRLRDSRNYYCWKVELPPARSSGPARLIQFAVIDGREQPHRVASFHGPITPDVRVRVDARGPVFTLYINGVAADTFTDTRIASGTVGFSNESGERAVVKTARVTD